MVMVCVVKPLWAVIVAAAAVYTPSNDRVSVGMTSALLPQAISSIASIVKLTTVILFIDFSLLDLPE
jgi:hypothetical protein